MARVLSTAFCFALLAATAGAFALTEGAKTELSPIYGTQIVRQVFSPTCKSEELPYQAADIEFRCASSERLDVWIATATATGSSTIVPGGRSRKGGSTLVVRRASSDDGVTILPDGTYLPVIRFSGDAPDDHAAEPDHARHDAAEVTPCPHRVYTPSRPTATAMQRRLPGAVHAQRARARGPARDGRQVVFTQRPSCAASLIWNGSRRRVLRRRGSTCSRSPRRTPPATARAAPVRRRADPLHRARPRREIVARPGGRFAILVLTDANDGQLAARPRPRHRTGRTRSACARRASPASTACTSPPASHTARAPVVVG